MDELNSAQHDKQHALATTLAVVKHSLTLTRPHVVRTLRESKAWDNIHLP